jgi:hypothetical protein
MKSAKVVKVVETKRKPPMWSVKVGARYKASYMGASAREMAIKFAESLGSDYELVEKQMTKRERARLDAIAGLSINKRK